MGSDSRDKIRMMGADGDVGQRQHAGQISSITSIPKVAGG